MRRVIIVAKSLNNVIGSQGKLPWELSEDLKLFRRHTINNCIIYGKRVFESFNRFPLPKRLNIVVSSTYYKDASYEIENQLYTAKSLEEALSIAQEKNYEAVFFCGGERIYKEALEKDLADEMIISVVPINISGDTYFPKVDYSDWYLDSMVPNVGFCTEYWSRK